MLEITEFRTSACSKSFTPVDSVIIVMVKIAPDLNLLLLSAVSVHQGSGAMSLESVKTFLLDAMYGQLD